MVSVLIRPAIIDITAAEERAIYDLLFNRGALTPEQVASAAGMDESAVAVWLANKAGLRVIDYDPDFGRYATFE